MHSNRPPHRASLQKYRLKSFLQRDTSTQIHPHHLFHLFSCDSPIALSSSSNFSTLLLMLPQFSSCYACCYCLSLLLFILLLPLASYIHACFKKEGLLLYFSGYLFVDLNYWLILIHSLSPHTTISSFHYSFTGSQFAQ